MPALEPGRPAEAELAFEAGVGTAGGAHGEPDSGASAVDFGAAPDDETDFDDAAVEQAAELEDDHPTPEPATDEPRPGPR